MADLSGRKVAIVLSGCGYIDGSDVHEVSAACSAITKMKGEVVFFAPKKEFTPINGYKNGGLQEHEDQVDGKREILVEASRVAGAYKLIDSITLGSNNVHVYFHF